MLFDFIKRFWFINPSTGFFIGGGGGSTARYQITNSVRLRASASAYFQRAAAVSATATKATTSFWLKRGALLASLPTLFGSASGFVFQLAGASGAAADTIRCYGSAGLGSTTEYISTDVFRDPAAWYHFCVIFDTTAAAADRLQVWVNNRRVAQANANYPTASGNINWQTTAQVQYIGTYGGAGYADGYFADFYHVGEQVKAATDFGEYNSDGVWVPKAYTGTYGTNGFHLDFKDAALTAGSNAGLGKDVSGNGNYWTTNNISVTAGVTYDSMVDTPTNNYATLNPIQPRGGNFATTLSDGALSYASAVGASFPRAYSTIPLAEAGSYFEFTCIAGDTAGPYFGISSSDTLQTPTSGGLGFGANEYGYQSSTGVFRNNNSTLATYATFTTGDVIAIAYKNGSLWIAKNNTWLNSGNPDSNTGAVATGLSTTTKWLAACATNNSGTKVAALNAGQQPWSTATSTARTTAATFGALCTANLPPVAIKNPAAHFNAKTRVGTAATYSVTGEAFQPDFVWVKSRGRALDHALYDSVRGVQKRLETNNTDAEVTGDSTGLTAFNSDGYTGGALDQINGTTATNAFVDWLWKAGGAPTTDNVAGAGNTPTAGSVKIDGANLGSALAGTIAATRLSANTTAGFSVVTYTGTGTDGATIAHGLGVTPKMIIVKCRNTAAQDWVVYHEKDNASPATGGLLLQGTNAFVTSAGAGGYWFSTAPGSNVFAVGNNGSTGLNTRTYVAHCFAEVAGYSKFGSYVGNSSADGTFVYCGFRPKYVVIKSSNNATQWYEFDAARDTYNLSTKQLYANLATLESGDAGEGANPNVIDLVANGFKIRSAYSGINNSSYTYIFAAFAEHPFGGSNVAPSPAR